MLSSTYSSNLALSLRWWLLWLQMSRYASGRFSGGSLLALPILGLDLLAWVILLAGVSALQQQCSSAGVGIVGTAPLGNLSPAGTCRNLYRFQWWTTILQLVILLGESLLECPHSNH